MGIEIAQEIFEKIEALQEAYKKADADRQKAEKAQWAAVEENTKLKGLKKTIHENCEAASQMLKCDFEDIGDEEHEVRIYFVSEDLIRKILERQ